MKKCKGFTLAEVLITLSILGVIAAVTIPSIQRNFQDRIQITQLKQAYATFDSAIRQMYAVEGHPKTWNWPDSIETAYYSKKNSDYYGEKLSKYLNISKFCRSADRNLSGGCLVNSKNRNKFYFTDNSNLSYATLSQNVSMWGTWVEHGDNGAAIILKNGMVISLGRFSKMSCLSPDRVRIDVNGDKGPNKYGYDVFFFHFDKNGLLDWKANTQCPSGVGLSTNCKKGNTGRGAGLSCSYWVFKHGNMDYKYRDVSSEW